MNDNVQLTVGDVFIYAAFNECKITIEEILRIDTIKGVATVSYIDCYGKNGNIHFGILDYAIISFSVSGVYKYFSYNINAQQHSSKST